MLAMLFDAPAQATSGPTKSKQPQSFALNSETPVNNQNNQLPPIPKALKYKPKRASTDDDFLLGKRNGS